MPWNKASVCGLSGHTKPQVALAIVSRTGPRVETVDPQVRIMCKHATCIAGKVKGLT